MSADVDTTPDQEHAEPFAQEIAAYSERLTETDEAHKLTAECMNAVIAFHDMDNLDLDVDDDTEIVGALTIGTLTSWRFFQGIGLFGPQLRIEITLCTQCVGQHSSKCVDSEPYQLAAAQEIGLFRNADGVRALAEAWGVA